jgi:antitoxin (DNA-binding transcriptional repressor) of toxin-antitoxin stability system
MQTATIQDVQARLPEILDALAPGEEVVITRNEKPVARLVAQEPPKRQPRKAGSAKGLLVILQEDDEHLKDFAEYME